MNSLNQKSKIQHSGQVLLQCSPSWSVVLPASLLRVFLCSRVFYLGIANLLLPPAVYLE
jgi:hypothetical protein